MTNATNHTILVIGSTGKTGRRVADQLEKRGIPVRRGSRTADSPFDWDAHRQGALPARTSSSQAPSLKSVRRTRTARSAIDVLQTNSDKTPAKR